MHGVQRTGVRFVLSNTADPARADDTSAWYDTYAAAITHPGLLVNAVRFENPTAAGTAADPRFAAIYDIAAPDPADAWPATETAPDYPSALFDDPRAQLLVPEFRGSYALVGSRTRPGGHGPLTGVYVVLSNGSNDTTRAQWAAGLLGTGQFYATDRFRLIEGAPEPAQWLELFETDSPTAASAYDDAVAALAPGPAIQSRLAGLFLPTQRTN